MPSQDLHSHAAIQKLGLQKQATIQIFRLQNAMGGGGNVSQQLLQAFIEAQNQLESAPCSEAKQETPQEVTQPHEAEFAQQPAKTGET
jgi:hypothetical protein